MTVCTDVYVRPQTCDLIEIYPSQVHPGGGGFPSPIVEVRREYGRGELRRVPRLDDDDVAIALALLLLE